MKSNYVKIFYDWNEVKIKVHFKRESKYFKQGEIWWCNVGQNIGTEINGKKEAFARPVLIYKKLSKDSFLAVPISTQNKKGTWYVKITLTTRNRIAILSQVKIMSSFRLISKKDKINKGDYESIKEGLRNLYIDTVFI